MQSNHLQISFPILKGFQQTDLSTPNGHHNFTSNLEGNLIKPEVDQPTLSSDGILGVVQTNPFSYPSHGGLQEPQDHLASGPDEGFLSMKTPADSNTAKTSSGIGRTKRFTDLLTVNVSVTEFLDTGIWYLALYNDGLETSQVRTSQIGTRQRH